MFIHDSVSEPETRLESSLAFCLRPAWRLILVHATRVKLNCVAEYSTVRGVRREEITLLSERRLALSVSAVYRLMVQTERGQTNDKACPTWWV